MSWVDLSLAMGILESNKRREKRSEDTADHSFARHLAVARSAVPNDRTGVIREKHTVPGAERFVAAAATEAVAIDAYRLNTLGAESTGWFEAAANARHPAAGAKRIYSALVGHDVQRVLLPDLASGEIPGIVNDIVGSLTSYGSHGHTPAETTRASVTSYR